MAFKFKCYLAFFFRKNFMLWDLPEMCSDDVDDVDDLLEFGKEVFMYNRWIGILNQGFAPVSCYQNSSIQDARYHADLLVGKDKPFDMGGFRFDIVLDNTHIDEIEIRQLRITMREMHGLELVSYTSLDALPGSLQDMEPMTDKQGNVRWLCQDKRELYSLLQDPLGEDPKRISLGYNMYPITKKLIEHPSLGNKVRELIDVTYPNMIDQIRKLDKEDLVETCIQTKVLVDYYVRGED